MKVYTILYRSNGKSNLARIKANSIMAARTYVVNFLHAQVITIE